MGLRARRSFRVAKGVRVNVTKTGVGLSVGRRGMHYSAHSSGRRTASVGIPGTGLSYVSSKGGARPHSRQNHTSTSQVSAVRVINRPGLFAPRAEKELYKIIRNGMNIEALDRAAELYPSHRYTALALAALKRMESDCEPDVALRQIRKVMGNGYNPETDSFARRYVPFISASVGVGELVVARLPYSKGLLALGASGILLKQGRQEEALKLAAYLQGSVAGEILLVELYEDCDQPEKILALTDSIANEDDASMLLLTLRGKALAKIGHLDAALETFKEALRYRSRPDQLKELAWFNRAKTYIEAGKPGMARRDLERIMAQNSSYPGLDELMQKTSSNKKPDRI